MNGGLEYLDEQIERVVTLEHPPVTTDATNQEIAPADSNRLRLVVAVPQENNIAVGANTFSLGVMRGATRITLAVLSLGQPSLVLRVEDYGQFLLERWVIADTSSAPDGRVAQGATVRRAR